MRLTPTLYVRRWLAKLHPPLPQTPRESQQLLQLLQGSFRKHLDEAHPSPTQRQPSSPPHIDIPLTSSVSSSSATAHYFNTVLNNPLLARSSESAKLGACLTSSATELFRKALNEGNVSVKLLRQVANDYIRGIRKGERVADQDRLAPKLASWVYTTSPAMKEAFLGSIETLKYAVQVTGLDQQEAIAWEWLRMLYERDFGSEGSTGNPTFTDLRWLSIEDFLVSCLMQISLRHGAVNDAAQQFVEACQYRSVSRRAAARPEDASMELAYIPMEHSWKRLLAAIVHYRNKHGVSEDLFNRVTTYGMSWDLAPDFSVPLTAVYHPTAPSALVLSRQLQTAESANQFLSGQLKAGRKSRRAMLIMILDGAQLSLEQGHQLDAQFLLGFAHTHYTEFLPSLPQRASSSLDVQIQHAQGELKAHSYNLQFAWS